jgi:hypothetical protein
LLSNGKIVAGGSFTTFNGISRIGAARLDTDGQVDLTFDPAASLSNKNVQGWVVLPDGSVVFGQRNFT